MENLTEATAAQIDTVLAELWTKTATARCHLASAKQRVARHANDRNDRNYVYWSDEVAKLTAQIDALVAEARPYTDEFVRRGGWTRYFLVANTNGHVHREMECNTCFATTQFRWLPTLSDCDEAAMVAEWGEMACTVCFPAAPTMPGFGDGTSGLARYTAAEKAARDAEKAARAHDKAAKAITAPDGSDLRVGPYRDHVRTIIAAERKLSSCVQDYAWYGEHPSDFAAQADQLVAALRARGIAEGRITGIIDRANKKVEDGAAKARYSIDGEVVAAEVTHV